MRYQVILEQSAEGFALSVLGSNLTLREPVCKFAGAGL